jgi:hypothetical protein
MRFSCSAPFPHDDRVHRLVLKVPTMNAIERSRERLKLSGFYELIPPGETGNEAGIAANTPADKLFGEK